MKPSIPKGTRDFTPEQIVKRNYIFDTVKSVFIKYGFQPIETPTMENLSTLTGKYGEEGDQLLFKILNSGDYLSNVNPELKLIEGIGGEEELEKAHEEFFNYYYSSMKEILKKSNNEEQEKQELRKFEEEYKSSIPRYFGNRRDSNFEILQTFLSEVTYEQLMIDKNKLKAGINKLKAGINDISKTKAKPKSYEGMIKGKIKRKFLYFIDDKIRKKRNQNFSLKKFTNQISEKGLRYDLTVPFARYVVMHQNEITFPFKRYQIQPVWRADRPQRGRFREFYQCDVDIVGSDSLMYEADLVNIYDEVFAKLGINTTIKINNRKVLQGIAEAAGIPDKMVEMTVAIDKLDKIGREGVRKEMRERGISDDAIGIIEAILIVKDLSDLKAIFKSGVSDIGLKGAEELETVFNLLSLSEQKNDVIFDITLARGLSYYTGCIFEVAANDVEVGSIGGGGRYDDLTGMFGLKGVSGVGVSFGAERIYLVMEELGLFPKDDSQNLKLLFVTFDNENFMYAYKALLKIRQAGINAELYPEPTKMKKQMKYADARNVPFVAIVGSEEMNEGVFAVKNMETGNQEKYDLAALIDLLR